PRSHGLRGVPLVSRCCSALFVPRVAELYPRRLWVLCVDVLKDRAPTARPSNVACEPCPTVHARQGGARRAWGSTDPSSAPRRAAGVASRPRATLRPLDRCAAVRDSCACNGRIFSAAQRAKLRLGRDGVDTAAPRGPGWGTMTRQLLA